MVFGLGELAAQDHNAKSASRAVAKMFRSRCIDCHTIPDAQYETDRAWLYRLKDTA